MATQSNSHPLPAPPGAPQSYRGQAQQQQQPQYQQQQQQQYQYQQQQYPQQQYRQQQQQQPLPQQPQPAVTQKPRNKSRTFSFQSGKSHKSSGSTGHIDLTETSAEKEAKRLHTKADPTMAMQEAEPSAVAATVKSSLASLRDVQHKDALGNPIADPDRSNPTRSRWERPLDTIRSFEAAIDGGYNRKSFIRTESSENVQNYNRRNSYYGHNGGRFPHDSYYGNRPQSTFSPQGQYDMRNGQQRESYFPENQQQGYHGGPPPPPHGGRQRYPRMASEPQFNTYRRDDTNVYPLPNNTRSYETVASASGSGSGGEPAGYQTDPTSSDNSSIERRQSPPKRQPDPVNDYGIGFNQPSAYQPSAFSVAPNANNFSRPGAPAAGYQQNGAPAPPVPQKDPRAVISRKPTAPRVAEPVGDRPSLGEKRKSWFSRRFSRQS